MTNMLRARKEIPLGCFLFSPFLVLEQVSVDSEITSFSRYPLVNTHAVSSAGVAAEPLLTLFPEDDLQVLFFNPGE